MEIVTDQPQNVDSGGGRTLAQISDQTVWLGGVSIGNGSSQHDVRYYLPYKGICRSFRRYLNLWYISPTLRPLHHSKWSFITIEDTIRRMDQVRVKWRDHQHVFLVFSVFLHWLCANFGRYPAFNARTLQNRCMQQHVLEMPSWSTDLLLDFI